LDLRRGAASVVLVPMLKPAFDVDATDPVIVGAGVVAVAGEATVEATVAVAVLFRSFERLAPMATILFLSINQSINQSIKQSSNQIPDQQKSNQRTGTIPEQ
jgi:hypothetical protein